MNKQQSTQSFNHFIKKLQGHELDSYQFQGPPTRKIFQEIQTRKERGKSAWLFKELDPNKNEWDLAEVQRVGYKLRAVLEDIKQTTLTKGTEDLNLVSTVRPVKVPKPASSSINKPLDTEGITKAYKGAVGTRLIISDYDGTLREFVDKPEAATPSLELISDLKTLSKNKNNMVWLVSGRDKSFLQKHFGAVENLGLKAAYGAATRDPISGHWETMKFDKSSLDRIKTIMEVWSSSVPHSHIEDKDYGLAYHYRVAHTQDRTNQERMTNDAAQAKKDIDLIYQSEAEFLKAFLDLHIEERSLPLVTILGNMVLEVKSKNLSKREAVQSLYKNMPHPDFVLIGGDDPADEVMFEVAHNEEANAKKNAQGEVKPPVVATVHVSHRKGKETIAKYMVTEPEEFRELLSKMSVS
ncbi:HAD-like domain-containing protein [Melampsora americana]|nr:HAD-like domain-containing protein [Melampsora americana]KAH9808350.1 HAD-like domain-containing protein [Melampsora americana]